MKLRGAMEVPVWLLAALVGALVSTFCCSGAWAQSTAGFTYVDCGATTGHVDSDTGITWVPDTSFISTGATTTVVVNSANASSPEFANLRYFSSALPKSCYTLPVIKNNTYYLRLSFYHGNYDSSAFASFKVGVDASVLTDVTIASPTVVYYWEYVIQPQRNVTFVCLMPNSAHSNPFISSIALRPVPDTKLPLRLATLLAQNETIYNAWRLNLGSATTTVRYPDDTYDRLWVPMPKSSPLVTATSLLEDLVATSDVSRGEILETLEAPLATLRTAITTSGNMTITLPPPMGAYVPSAHFVLYFAELDAACNTSDRQFHIHVPDLWYSDRYENPLNYSGFGAGDWWQWSDMIYPTTYSVLLYPNVTLRTSLRGPIVNALELSHTLGKNALPTNVGDMTAIEVIKREMSLANWSGDPCLPNPHPWLSCANTSTGEFEIRAVNLTGYHLTGPISTAFADLTHLTVLVLDDNQLVGNLPDLRRLINLEKLHVQKNSLSGTVPAWLFSLPSLRQLYIQNNNFSPPLPPGWNESNSVLDFKYDGNPYITGIPPASNSTGSSKKKTSIGLIAGASVGGAVVVLALVGILVFFCCRRKRSTNNNKSHTPIPTFEPANQAPRIPGARLLTYQEIVDATSNFQRELGKGGFGTVYYGKLKDGQEIAVKVLNKFTVEGSSAFLNEVDILSRVHHKNLVTMIGYCDAAQKPMLVYEFVHNGSLRDVLSGSSFLGPEALDWNLRLQIAINAAQGLEYLHTSCSPSFIHRDVKSSNVLLTTKFEAKIADFGLSRLVKEQEPTQFITKVTGTPGYIDPEYFQTNLLSTKTDVFSFGVVLLELITGRLPLDTSRQDQGANLCDWVRRNLEAGNMNDILYPAIGASRPNHDALWKVAETAMYCVEPKSVNRPTMSKVVQDLQVALQMSSPAPYYSSSMDSSGPYKDHVAMPGPR